MINDVSRVLLRWQEPLVIKRVGVGDYVDGVWDNGATSDIDIFAVVQNATQDELILLPEGTRTTESVKIHTITQVKTVSEFGETDADTFQYNGFNYRLFDVFDRKVGNYYKAVAIRLPQ